MACGRGAGKTCKSWHGEARFPIGVATKPFEEDCVATTDPVAEANDRLFYTGMGIAVALTAFAGFARTYYLAHWFEAPGRMPVLTPLLHIHALMFTVWIALGALQPALIAAGRPGAHRTLGWLGAGTALVVWLLGNMVAVDAIHRGYKGVGDPYAFYAITFFSIQAFGLLVLLAILFRNRAEAHKRLMLLSSAAILEAAFGRLPLELVAETAPFSFYVGPDLIIIAGVIYDRVSRGRVHRVWFWGGGALVASQLLRVAIMDSPPWLALARYAAALWAG